MAEGPFGVFFLTMLRIWWFDYVYWSLNKLEVFVYDEMQIRVEFLFICKILAAAPQMQVSLYLYGEGKMQGYIRKFREQKKKNQKIKKS